MAEHTAANQSRPTTKERAGDIIEVLAELWPAAFAVEPRLRKPLKVGIDADVLAVASGAITSAELTVALNSYVRTKAYLRALRVGTPRIGLDGEAAGVVSAQEAAHARWCLERTIAKESARVRARGLAQRAQALERPVLDAVRPVVNGRKSVHPITHDN